LEAQYFNDLVRRVLRAFGALTSFPRFGTVVHHVMHLDLIHAFSKIQPLHSIMDNIPHNDRIKFAIAYLESQARFNFSASASK
jgi:hypothetical protein